MTDEGSVAVATNLEVPPAAESNSSLINIVEPEDGWLFPADPDVKLALQVTFAIAFILIIKVVYDSWQVRRRLRRLGSDENDERHRASTRRRIDEALEQRVHECPICLADASYPVLTDCGHIFCCQCIIQYWQQSKAIVSPCDCAMCRCTFYMLLPVRWPSLGTSDAIDDQLQENNMRIDDYNRRFSVERPALDFIRDIPVLIPYLIRNFFNHDIFTVIYQIRIGFVISCVFAYFIVPFDIVPESAYGMVGFLDDCIIGVLVLCAIVRWFRNYMAERGRVHHHQQ